MRKSERERKLEKIIVDTLWMALRYADGRSTYAPTLVNRAIEQAEELGIVWDNNHRKPKFASDGQFGNWDSEFGDFKK